MPNVGVFNVNRIYKDRIIDLKKKRFNSFLISRELGIPLFVVRKVRRQR